MGQLSMEIAALSGSVFSGRQHAGWGPVRPMQFDGNCGTALVSSGTAYRTSPRGEVPEVRSFYFWRVRTLHRNSGFNRFEEQLTFGVTFV